MSIEVTDLVPIGRGIERPEQVLVTSDGRVFASDKGSAVAELLGENDIRRIGNAGGDPNGIAIDNRGHFLIANFGSGVLQELDPISGEITTLLSGDVNGHPLKWLNYVLVDSSGALWCSVSTATEDFRRHPRHGDCRRLPLPRRARQVVGRGRCHGCAVPQLHGAGPR